jgi:hypothetical protein
MAKKHFTLQVQDDFDFLLIGLFCAYRDYRLCYELNQKLEISLERCNDLEVKMEKKGSTSLFPIFCCSNIDEEHHFVIGNKGSNGNFLQEMKQVDYFLMIRNPSPYSEITALLKSISEIKLISSAIEIQTGQLKSSENFLLIEPVKH